MLNAATRDAQPAMKLVDWMLETGWYELFYGRDGRDHEVVQGRIPRQIVGATCRTSRPPRRPRSSTPSGAGSVPPRPSVEIPRSAIPADTMAAVTDSARYRLSGCSSSRSSLLSGEDTDTSAPSGRVAPVSERNWKASLRWISRLGWNR